MSMLLFSLHSLEVLNDGQDHFMRPLHNRRNSCNCKHLHRCQGAVKEVSTDLNDVNAVEWVDQEQARGTVHLVPALTASGQLLVVGCARRTRVN